MESQYQTRHIRLELKSSYDDYIRKLESVLNRLDGRWSEGLAVDPEGVRKHLTEVAGESGLMIFGDLQHGKLLNLYEKKQKAVQYAIGNPLKALEMTKFDIRASLYAPVKMIIYEAEDGTVYAEYDLPSTQFGQFGDEVTAVAKDLDNKLINAILKADN